MLWRHEAIELSESEPERDRHAVSVNAFSVLYMYESQFVYLRVAMVVPSPSLMFFFHQAAYPSSRLWDPKY